LNSCPYRANSFFHHRPLFVDSIGATTILTRGGLEALKIDREKIQMLGVVKYRIQQVPGVVDR
jgi:hypothetical protein